MDIYDVRKRSEVMSRIPAQHSRLELHVRKALHRLGLRFRLHCDDLPGKPDIVLKRFRAVIFVHGCFWHGHRNCKRSKLPASNREFWKNKIAKNVERDALNIQKLQSMGWKVVLIWQCQTEISRLEKKIYRTFSVSE